MTKNVIPFYFCDLSEEAIFSLELMTQKFEESNDREIEEYLKSILIHFEGKYSLNELELKKLIDAFIFNLALESMRRKGLITISKKIYILDRNSMECEIGLGLRFQSCE